MHEVQNIVQTLKATKCILGMKMLRNYVASLAQLNQNCRSANKSQKELLLVELLFFTLCVRLHKRDREQWNFKVKLAVNASRMFCCTLKVRHLIIPVKL